MVVMVDTSYDGDYGAYGTIRIPLKNASTIVVEWGEVDGFGDGGPYAQMFVEGPGMVRRTEPRKVRA